MNTNKNSNTNGFATPPVHSTETGRQYVRPIDILRSEKGREQLRLLRLAKLVEVTVAPASSSTQPKS